MGTSEKTFDFRLANVKAVMLWGIFFIHSDTVLRLIPHSSGLLEAIYRGGCSLLWGSLGTFFLISGYFAGDYNNLAGYFNLVVRRSKSLLVPFFLWNAIYICCYMLGATFSSATAARAQDMELYSLMGVADAMFGITRNPADGPLWYIRNIFVYILLLPLWKYGIYKFKLLFLLILSLIMCLVYPLMPYAVGRLFISYGVIAFAIGYFMKMNNMSLYSLSKYKIIVFMLLVVFFIPENSCRLKSFLSEMNILPLLVMPFWIFIAGFLSYEKDHFFYRFLTIPSFYVYASHALIGTGIFRICARFIPAGEYAWILGILIFFIGGCIGIYTSYYLLKIFAPQVLSRLNGGRI